MNYGATEGTPTNLKEAHRLVTSSVTQPTGEADTSQNPQRVVSVLRNIIDIMDIALWELDTNYIIVSLNRKAEELYGKDCIGKLCYSVAAKRDSVCSECPVQMVYDGAASGRSEHYRIDTHGEKRYIDHIATPLKDGEGNLTGAFVLIIDITKHKLTELELRNARYELEMRVEMRTAELTQAIKAQKMEILQRKLAEETLKLILESAGEGIFGLDFDGNLTFINPAAARMLGYKSDELIGRHSHSLWHHTKTDGSLYPVEECPIYMALKDGAVHHIRDEVFWKKDNTSFDVAYTSTPILDNDKIVGSVVTFRDITERKRFENKLVKSEDNLRRLIERNPVAMAVVDKSGKFIFLNNRFITTFGYTIEDMPTVDHWWSLAYPDEHYRQKVVDSWKAAAIKAIKDKKETGTQEWRVICKDGSLRDIEFKMASLQEVNIVIYNDITDRKKAEELLRHISTIDELTGLANRRAFDTFLYEEWRRALRDKSQISMLMIDVDFFKQYNDTYGHLKGDECLKAIAEVLEIVTRRPRDKVARFGGEEFVAVFSSADYQYAVSIAEKIRMEVEALKIPHEKSDINSFVTISVGVALIVPNQNISPIDLIKSADQALYRAKEEGRNRVVI
jgi:diguanylate cyclase (GGDEF)-like protein/PAS domain S-box-containing protein